MVRTKNQIRGSKSKGSQFEYDCHASLQKAYPDIALTKQQGYQTQLDLVSQEKATAFECKRWAGVSWNQLLQIYMKLQSRAPYYKCFVLFQCNRQPPLVFAQDTAHHFVIMKFEDVFGPFIKHESSRKPLETNTDNIPRQVLPDSRKHTPRL